MLFSCFKEECIGLNESFTSKEEVLKRIATIARKSDLVQEFSEETIFAGLIEREKLGSTGFENGVAIPHCTLQGLSNFVVGLITVPQGVDFDSFDQSKAEIIFFILAPQEKRNEHIRLLSQISNVLHVKNIKQELFSAKTPQSFKENFFRHVSIDLDKNKVKKYQEFTVVVQQEEVFEDILRIFSDTDDCSVSVLEAKNSLSFLESQPLFSSFWNDEAKGFNRIIIAIVKNSLANETIRKLNLFIDKDKEAGLMVTVKDVFYMNGKLNL